ncbi:MAG: hypothetical protein QGM50_04425 [Anaerolineae bacterium]|nr:hypothetical protein [Anaerolineae bacterium]MDK1118019.1 hypothetical protein [Anaerolineae bacterium]
MQQMIGKMARMYPMLIALGFMIVLAAFLIGYTNSQTVGAYFAESKVVRETTLMTQRAAIESVGLWLPPFKFLGIGLILGGIVMALRIIIDNLKGAGQEVLSNLPEGKRPSPPSAPWYGKLMPMVMMLGELIFIAALVVGLRLAGIARSVFASPLPEIDAAGPGSALLNGIQTIHAVEGWLVPLKFFGIATEFLAITMGLATIIYILSAQTKMLDNVLGTGAAR